MVRRRLRTLPTAAIFALAAVPWIAPADFCVAGLPAWALYSLAVTAIWSAWLARAMQRGWDERGDDDGL
jgi:hypothetical protein